MTGEQRTTMDWLLTIGVIIGTILQSGLGLLSPAPERAVAPLRVPVTSAALPSAPPRAVVSDGPLTQVVAVPGVRLRVPDNWVRTPEGGVGPEELLRAQRSLLDPSLYEMPLPTTAGLLLDAGSVLSIRRVPASALREATRIEPLEVAVKGLDDRLAEEQYDGVRSETRWLQLENGHLLAFKLSALEEDWPKQQQLLTEMLRSLDLQQGSLGIELVVEPPAASAAPSAAPSAPANAERSPGPSAAPSATPTPAASPSGPVAAVSAAPSSAPVALAVTTPRPSSSPTPTPSPTRSPAPSPTPTPRLPLFSPSVIPPLSIPLSTTERTRVDILRRAREMLGIPYVWGGNDPATGLDCSAYVSLAWDVARQTTDSMSRVSHHITRAELRPGDALNLTKAQDSSGRGHIRIFEAWANQSRTLMWVYEQTPPRSVRHVIAYDARYQPIRLDGLDGSGSTAVLPAVSVPPRTRAPSTPTPTRSPAP